MSETPNEVWDVQPGDRFVPFATQWWMNEHDHGEHRHLLDTTATTLGQAIKRGLRAAGSDDFNIAAIRGGRMVAVLWMNEDLDEDPVVVEQIEAELGLGGERRG